MDVREIAIWHKGAQISLLNGKIERLAHLRLAQMESPEGFEKEVERLQNIQMQLLNIQAPRPQTPEECAQARFEFAKAVGLKILNKK